MKIIETGILAHSPQILATLLKPFPVVKLNLWGIDVYRFEIDEDMVIMFYDLLNTAERSDELIEHLKYHLDAVLVTMDAPNFENQYSQNPRVIELVEAFSECPMVIALVSERVWLHTLSSTARENAFYLSDKGNIVFWDPEDAASRGLIWQALYKHLNSMPGDIETVESLPEQPSK